MKGADAANARLAEPSRPPLDRDRLTVEGLTGLGRLLADRTATMDLDHWFWGEGVALDGLVALHRAARGPAAGTGDRPLPARAETFLDHHLWAGFHLEHVNNVAPGLVALEAAAAGDDRATAVCDHLAAWVQTDPAVTRSAGGAIEHWPGGVWADTCYMAGVFLARLGVQRGDPGLVATAAAQVVAHHRVLQDPVVGLMAHGSHRDDTIWCFWGRANAWMALAAVEVLEAGAALRGAGVAHPDELTGLLSEVNTGLARQLAGLAEHQPAHGVWDVLVDGQVENRGILETSAAAGLAAAFLRAAALGLDPAANRAVGWRALAGALAYVDAAGTLTRTSAGTVLQLIPFGYSVIRDDRIQPWGQGLALHAVAAGLTELRAGRAPEESQP